MKIKNPIIPGFYPDPSICKAGDDYYLVCSSFELYPGIPIFHSKNLIEWEQLGHVMTKENGFHTIPNTHTGGVMAPTIRYHDGRFYVINANFADKGNFIVTTDDPKNGWSAPTWLDDIPGIDASLFIDDDGSAYIIGTGEVVERADGSKDKGIYIAPFDLKNMKRIGYPKAIWDSALRVASSPEAPHIYKKDGYYYLVIAEGGTEHFHSVSVARSKTIDGWYEGNPANPVMTHRQLGFKSEISNVGHADFVEGPNGDWYAVLLASRTIDGYYKNLGRETFICPISWERGWPYLSPETGKIESSYEIEGVVETGYKLSQTINLDMTSGVLPNEMVLWGTPYEEVYRFENNELVINCLERSISERLRRTIDKEKNTECNQVVGFIGCRQTEPNVLVETTFTFEPKEKEVAGLVIMQASNHQFKVQLVRNNGQKVLELVQVTTKMNKLPHFPGFESETGQKVLASIYLKNNIVEIKFEAVGQDYTFHYKVDNEWELLGKTDGRIINPEIVGCMSGTMIGMFASANGDKSDNAARFSKFYYTVK